MFRHFNLVVRFSVRSELFGQVGRSRFPFFSFYVQHFVLARFPLRLLLLCSVQYPPSRAAIGRWHIFSNPNWSRILNITHDIYQVRVVLCGFFCFSIIKTRGGFVAAVSCQRAIEHRFFIPCTSSSVGSSFGSSSVRRGFVVVFLPVSHYHSAFRISFFLVGGLFLCVVVRQELDHEFSPVRFSSWICWWRIFLSAVQDH